MQIIDYISKNKEWIFSGCGISIILLLIWAVRQFFSPNIDRKNGESQTGHNSDDEIKTNHWDSIRPTNSKMKVVSKTVTSLPLGVQFFSFVYGSEGDAYPLILQQSKVRAEIQFSCQVENPMLAIYEGNEYALNFLQPQFLVNARPILEKYSLTILRDKREEIALEVKTKLSDSFSKFGFKLLSVNIGALE